MDELKQPLLIDHQFFYDRAIVAFGIMHMGRRELLPLYDKVQEEFWMIVESSNVIWRKSDDLQP